MHPATLSCGRVTHHLACHPANTFGHQKGTKSLSEGKVEDQLSGALRLASKPEQVVSRWRLGYTIPPCVCVCARVPLQKSRAVPCTITKKLTPVQTERARVCCCICSWRDRTWFFFSSNSDFNPVKPSRALFCDSWPVERSQSSCANHQTHPSKLDHKVILILDNS